MQRCGPEDYLLRWQTFLIDGFEDWIPLAQIASAQLPKTSPREVLKWMIKDFYFPDGVEQSDDSLIAKVEGIAMAFNANVRDPKTGEIIGRMRDFGPDGKKRPAKPPAPPRIDPVRERKRKKAEREAARKAESKLTEK